MRSPVELYRTTRLLAANTKSLEAQVFRRVLYQLDISANQSRLEQTKALADLRVLWVTVLGLATEPDTHLPPAVQLNLQQLAEAVIEQLDLPVTEQDRAWLIEVTEQIAQGLEP